MNQSRRLLLIVLVGLVGGFFSFNLQHFFSLEILQTQHAAMSDYYHAHPVKAMLGYAAFYIVVAGLSLPGATIMTLAGGAVFGLAWGMVLVSLASTIGATVAMLASRYVFRDAVASRFGRHLQAIDDGIARDGWLYLFTLRLVPVFPYFMVNLAMGLTKLPVLTFFWVSQLGMVAATFVYVNAGTQLAKIDSLSGILSPELLLSFSLLGIFPWLAKRVVAIIKAVKVDAQR